jgi:uncharacterized protein (DUF362 family)
MNKPFNPYPNLNRREFLRLVSSLGILGAASALLEACSGLHTTPQAPAPTFSPAPTPIPSQARTSTSPPSAIPAPSQTASPSPTTPANFARVAFVNTSDRVAGVQQALDLLGIEPFQGESIFLKANYNSADPPPASTHPDILKTLVGRLQEMGAGQITLGERSGMGNTRQVLSNLGVFDLAQQMGFQVMVLDELAEPKDWVPFNLGGDHWSRGFYVARPCLEAGAIVQTCCLKTHMYGGHFTMSLKNSVGLVGRLVPGISHNFMTELHSSNYQREMIAEVNLAYSPALIVLDGIKAFTSGGPAAGKEVSPEVILAGSDRVAIDAVGVALLRYFNVQGVVAEGLVFKQAQIARAVELGLGVDSPDKIELVTADEQSKLYAEKIKAILIST